MILKCSCKQCGQNMEFEDSMLGEVIACPSCGGDTELYHKKVNSTPGSPYEVKMVSHGVVAASWICLFLGGVVSFIPFLGIPVAAALFFASFICAIVSIFQSRVASGVVLLCLNLVVAPLIFVVGQITGSAAVSGFVEGVEQANSTRQTNTNDVLTFIINPASEQQTKSIIDADLIQRGNNLIQSGLFDVSQDELTGKIEVSPKYQSGRRGILELAVVDTGDGDPALIFYTRYTDEDWIFMKTLQCRIENNIHSVVLDDTHTDVLKHGNVWESFQVNLKRSPTASKLIKELIQQTGPILTRLQGTGGRCDFYVTDNDIALMKGLIVIWESKGGNFDSLP